MAFFNFNLVYWLDKLLLVVASALSPDSESCGTNELCVDEHYARHNQLSSHSKNS
jgi:hypothetical protein